jgi:protein-tyrosine phosphatase
MKSMTQTYQPSLIIDGLYLGAREHAEDPDVLSACGITHVVNVTDSLPNLFSKERHLAGEDKPLDYCRLPVRDMRAEGIHVFFDSACSFIGAALDGEGGGQVLVHCMAGRSRSATIVLAYLVKCRGYDLASAFELVRTKRPSAFPNLGFWRQLETFEKQIRGESSATPEEYVKAKAMDVKLNATEEQEQSASVVADATGDVADILKRFLLVASAQLGSEAEAMVLSRWPADKSADAATAELAHALSATLEGSAEHIRYVPRLLWLLAHHHGVLSNEQVQQALVDGILRQDLDDLQIDIPHVWRHVASICDGCHELGLLAGDVLEAHNQVLARARTHGS